MKKYRTGVFETNSSSSHTIAITGHMLSEEYLKKKDVFPVDDMDGKIHVSLEDAEYGWGYQLAMDPWEKLKYAIMMVIETECRSANCKKIEDVYELEGFKLIQSAVDFPIVLEDDTFRLEEWTDGNGGKHQYVEHSGYIDHQSHEDYGCLNDFLNSWGVDILNFIYNPSVELEISNDNM